MKHNAAKPRPEQPLPPGTSPPRPEAAAYRRPQVYALGTAAELIRRGIVGIGTDAIGGWYVWTP